jgi:ABC-type antimicrobial peptide transport system permease subunit
MPPETLITTVRQIVAAIDPDLPVTSAGALRTTIDSGMRSLDLIIANLAISAGLGLLLAAIGLFGVISQLTAQRTRDIGVRIALGARYRDIMQLVLGEGVVLLLIGITIGVPIFWALNSAMHRTMPEMIQPGLWLLAVNLAVLTSTMLFACWLPARRAAKIDPIIALRSE